MYPSFPIPKRNHKFYLTAALLITSGTPVSSQTQDAPSPLRLTAERVAITLVHPEFTTDVEVPLAYLGPRFLELSQRNRLGGRQRRFLIEFYYPSMRPNVPENSHLGDEERLLYASVTNGTRGGTLRLARVNIAEDAAVQRKATGRTVCDLREYDSFSRLYRHYYHSDVLADDASYREQDGVFLGDVHASCPATALEGVGLCRFSFEFENRLFADLNGVPGSMFCEWPELRDGLRELTQTFLIIEN